MPLVGSIGTSSNTCIKQESFAQIVATHIEIVSHIHRKKNDWVDNERYLYIDLNSGSGHYNGIDGSPLKFLKLASQNRGLIAVEAHFIERSKPEHENLKWNVFNTFSNSGASFGGDNDIYIPFLGKANLYCQDNSEWIGNYIDTFTHDRRQTFGMIYSDPNNHEANFDGLSRLSNLHRLTRTDILIHFPATTLKRVRSVNSEIPRLKHALNGINKKHWLIREPNDRHQWTFLIGTNWHSFPKFEHLGFYLLDSDQGREVFEKLDCTANELACSEKKTIQHTKNICVTPDLGLFGAML